MCCDFCAKGGRGSCSLSRKVSHPMDLRSLCRKDPCGYYFVLPILYHQMQQKVVMSELFRGKKEGYAEVLSQPFADSRIGKYVFPSVHSLLLF